MQANYPVLRYWLSAMLLVLAIAASSRAQIGISIGAMNAAVDEEQIEAALAARGSLDVVEIPLHKVVQELGRQFRVQIVLSPKKLEEASVSPDTPVTKKLSSLPLESILRLVLADMELGFTVRENVLLISTPEDIESRLDTRIYPILDLVRHRIIGSHASPLYSEPDYETLIDIIICSVQPNTWNALGGPASINASENAAALVVSQTRDAHREIETLLTSLRRVKVDQGIPSLPTPSAPSQRVSLPHSLGSAIPKSAARSQSWQLPKVHAEK